MCFWLYLRTVGVSFSIKICYSVNFCLETAREQELNAGRFLQQQQQEKLKQKYVKILSVKNPIV